MEEDPPVVCRVTPEGEVICDPVTGPEASIADATSRRRGGAKQKKATALASQKKVAELVGEVSADGNWGPNKIKLLIGIIQALGESTLPDEPNIPRRSGEIIQAMKFLLDKQPPSILLFNYSTQPADVVGAYFLNKADLVRMQKLYDTFKSPKPF